MNTDQTSRRAFLSKTLKSTVAITVASIFKLIPEARPAFAAKRDGETTVRFDNTRPPPLEDPNYQTVIASIKRSGEYRRYKSNLSSQPEAYWVHSTTGLRFADFIVQAGPYTNDHFKVSPLQLLQTLTFAVDANNKVAGVFLATPDAESLNHSSLRSTLQDLRSVSQESIEHNVSVTSVLNEIVSGTHKSKLDAKTVALKSISADITVPLGCGPYCDCTANTMYGCCGQTCGGGYIDENCQFTCSLACAWCKVPACIVACLVACRAACWVPPYCYCSCWYCRQCAC